MVGHPVNHLDPVMPDCRGVGESRIYSKRANEAPLRDLSLSLASQPRSNQLFIIQKTFQLF